MVAGVWAYLPSKAEAVRIGRSGCAVMTAVAIAVGAAASAAARPDESACGKVGPSGLDECAEVPAPSACRVDTLFPHGRIDPRFYAYNGRSLQRAQYDRCVAAESLNSGKHKASAHSFPKIGTCYFARTHLVGARFGPFPVTQDDGFTVGLSNGMSLVEYSYRGAMRQLRVGDRVRACVIDLPKECPADDLRGIGYRVTNLRTGRSFIIGDSQHVCRGA